MRILFFLSTIAMFALICSDSHAQTFRKFDSTMKIGKAGYKVTCTNRNLERNSINISPIGFDNSMRDFAFEVKGRVRRAEVDDLNRDNFPDLVLYIYTNDTLNKGTVVCISSESNTSVVPCTYCVSRYC
jgi:hypothetical protein